MLNPVSILAVSGFAALSGSPLRDLEGKEVDADAQFFDLFKNSVRRASRYVKFANLAAYHAVKQLDPEFLRSQRIGFFLGTGLGNTSDVVKFTSEVFHNYATTVSPAAFINTVNNAGVFYIARWLGVECTATVVSQETLSFEAALLMGQVALNLGEIDLAFVGGVDVFEPPAHTTLSRLNSKGARLENLGEGSTFIVLAREGGPTPVLGRLLDVRLGMAGLSIQPRAEHYLSMGIDHTDSELVVHSTKCGAHSYSYRHLCGDYATHSGFGLCKFVSDKALPPKRSLYHYDSHHEGLSAAFSVECGPFPISIGAARSL